MSLPDQQKEAHLNRKLSEIVTAVLAAFFYMFEMLFVLIAHTFTVVRDLVSKLVSLSVEVTVFLIEIVKSAVRAAKDGSIYITRMFLELIVLLLNWCKAWVIHSTPNQGKGKGKGKGDDADKKGTAALTTLDVEWGPSGSSRSFDYIASQNNNASNNPNIQDDIARAEDVETKVQKIILRIEKMIKDDVAMAINVANRYDYYARTNTLPKNINEYVGIINFPRSSLRYSGEVRIVSYNNNSPTYEATGFGVLYNGCEIIYRGQMLGDLRHGFGVFSQLGERYEGQFMNDKYNGLGKLTRSNFIYIGEFKDGCFNGIGSIEYTGNAADHTRHFGEFHHGVACGYGVRMIRDRDFRKGLFEGSE